MLQSREKNGSSPCCKACGHDTARLGTLPKVGIHPLLHVYKCDTCHQITSIVPDVAPLAPN